MSWSFGFSGQGTAAFWDLQRVLSAFGESSQIKSTGTGFQSSTALRLYFIFGPYPKTVNSRAKEGKSSTANKPKTKINMVSHRHCWAIPPNRCSASREYEGYWDFEKDLLEVFSICCPANEVRSSYWDSEKDLLEVFSICCPANEVRSSYWDSEKDLLEVFSICCPANEVRSGFPTHRTLQQEVESQSNSCFPNTRSRTSHIDLDTICWCHQ